MGLHRGADARTLLGNRIRGDTRKLRDQRLALGNRIAARQAELFVQGKDRVRHRLGRGKAAVRRGDQRHAVAVRGKRDCRHAPGRTPGKAGQAARCGLRGLRHDGGRGDDGATVHAQQIVAHGGQQPAQPVLVGRGDLDHLRAAQLAALIGGDQHLAFEFDQFAGDRKAHIGLVLRDRGARLATQHPVRHARVEIEVVQRRLHVARQLPRGRRDAAALRARTGVDLRADGGPQEAADKAPDKGIGRGAFGVKGHQAGDGKRRCQNARFHRNLPLQHYEPERATRLWPKANPMTRVAPRPLPPKRVSIGPRKGVFHASRAFSTVLSLGRMAGGVGSE